LDETETDDAKVKAIVAAIVIVVGTVIGVAAIMWAEAWLVSTMLSIAFGVECRDLWALAVLILLFNLSVHVKSDR
jgi:hypothetical protein